MLSVMLEKEVEVVAEKRTSSSKYFNIYMRKAPITTRFHITKIMQLLRNDYDPPRNL